MEKGIVKWFYDKKGYGFIESNDGKDVFFYQSAINMLGLKRLAKGDRVTFEIKPGKKGLAASNVKKVDVSHIL